MNDAPLLVSRCDAVATLTLNRPQSGNTINLPMAEALLAAVADCEADPSVRCVVLTGAGKLFCGGGDLTAFASEATNISEVLNELAGMLHKAVLRLMHMNKPLLVLVNGPAAGAGLSLAIAGDIVIAAKSASFTAAYGSVGLSPDGGMSWLLPRLVGLRKAQEIIIANRQIDSAEAEAIGLVTRTIDDHELLAEGERVAAPLAAGPTLAIGAARHLLLNSYTGTLEHHLGLETTSIVAMGATVDVQEGVAAFAQRRKPVFTGA